MLVFNLVSCPQERNSIAMNIRILLISIIAFTITSCSLNSDVNEPVDLLWDKLGEKTDNLIIFLPGLYDTAEVFKKKQFFTVAREAGIKADFVAASIHVDHLLQGKLNERMNKDILQDAVKYGYKNIWLVGLSLGGLNSLLFYSKHPQKICGVVVLAPYLAGKSMAKEILAAGGIKKWQAKPASQKETGEVEIIEQYKLWQWLKEQNTKNKLGQVYIGYGDRDTYVAAGNILASLLDKKNVTVIEGRHNLKTAIKLWKQQLLTRKQTGLLQSCN